MGTKKVYDVMVDHQVVFSGAYRSAVAVFDSVLRSFAVVPFDYKPSVVVAFRPDLSEKG